MKKVYIYIFLLILSACKKTEESNPNYFQNTSQPYQDQKITPDDVDSITEQELETFHSDETYKYHYRTGNSGSYEYNYEVIGFDENDNNVSGEINVEGKYGAGKITDEEGIEHDVEIEWYDNGKIRATDENEMLYELTVK